MRLTVTIWANFLDLSRFTARIAVLIDLGFLDSLIYLSRFSVRNHERSVPDVESDVRDVEIAAPGTAGAGASSGAGGTDGVSKP